MAREESRAIIYMKVKATESALKLLEDIEEEDKVFSDINIDDWRK